jgi:hypothetical protein
MMKMAGVSLIAAARPIPIPAGCPRDARRTSVRMRASRNRLTWPRYSVCHTGSSSRPSATRAATAVLEAWYPASFRVVTHETAKAAMDASSHAARAMPTDTALTGANMTAAKGG